MGSVMCPPLPHPHHPHQNTSLGCLGFPFLSLVEGISNSIECFGSQESHTVSCVYLFMQPGKYLVPQAPEDPVLLPVPKDTGLPGGAALREHSSSHQRANHI